MGRGQGPQAGLGRVADAARMVGRAAKALTIAPTPILRGGQFTIEQILATCGEGEPMERGEAFRDGASAFKAVGERLVAARPGSAWQGTAAKNYANKVSEQENDVAVMVDADTDMATNISDEADLVYRLRELLTRQHQWLADIGSWTQYLGAGGAPGRVMQVEIESWAVGMAMMECLPAAWNTWSDARGIADKIDTITRDEYTKTANEVTISDSTGDFDPPRGAQLETDPQVIRGYAGVQESVAEKTADAMIGGISALYGRQPVALPQRAPAAPEFTGHAPPPVGAVRDDFDGYDWDTEGEAPPKSEPVPAPAPKAEGQEIDRGDDPNAY